MFIVWGIVLLYEFFHDGAAYNNSWAVRLYGMPMPFLDNLKSNCDKKKLDSRELCLVVIPPHIFVANVAHFFV